MCGVSRVTNAFDSIGNAIGSPIGGLLGGLGVGIMSGMGGQAQQPGVDPRPRQQTPEDATPRAAEARQATRRRIARRRSLLATDVTRGETSMLGTRQPSLLGS